MAVAVPIAGGTSMPLSVIFSTRERENCRMPPFTLPCVDIF